MKKTTTLRIGNPGGKITTRRVSAVVRSGWALHLMCQVSDWSGRYIRENRAHLAGDFTVSHADSGQAVVEGVRLDVAEAVLAALVREVPDLPVTINSRSHHLRPAWLSWFGNLSRGEVTTAPAGDVFA